MNIPKITTVGVAAALLLFSALLFGERAEAGSLFPAGDYENHDKTMKVSSGGEFRRSYVHNGTRYWETGFLL